MTSKQTKALTAENQELMDQAIDKHGPNCRGIMELMLSHGDSKEERSRILNKVFPPKAFKIKNGEVNPDRFHPNLKNMDEDTFVTTANQLAAIYGSDDLVQVVDSLNMAFSIKPEDTTEAIIATQLTALQEMTMKAVRGALIKDQPFEIANSLANRAAKGSRACTKLIEALDKHRGKGNQKITVQHVTVNDGGQAMVGNVSQGGGNG